MMNSIPFYDKNKYCGHLNANLVTDLIEKKKLKYSNNQISVVKIKK